jgi:two-component system, chemotaxis family, protein-glutamate methylesterase/glutaminase
MSGRSPDLVVIGASWGGLRAVGLVLGEVDPSAGPPAIAVALHRSPSGPVGTLVHYLQTRCPLPVAEVEDKDEIVPGQVYVAPADYHLLVEEPGLFALSVDPPVQYSRPSIDVLFESAADAYRGGLVAVVLTGTNEDGCCGIRRAKERGAVTIVQEPATAERRDMPDAAIATGCVDEILTLEQIGKRLNELAAGVG